MPIKLKNIAISFIFLVKAGANNRKIIIKAAAGEPSIEFEVPIIKIDEERRRFYSIVYPANEEDQQGEYATPEDIEKAAYGFMKNLRALNIDKDHNFEKEGAYVAESWLIRKDDPLFSDDPEGSWAIGVIVEDDEIWKQILDGDIEAISMGGVADKVKDQELGKALNYREAKTTSNFWEMFNPLESSIRSILDDDEIEDKGASISESIDQFKEDVLSNVSKEDDENSLFEKIRKALTTEIFHKNSKKGGITDMKKEEVQAMIDESIEKAVKELPKPITKEQLTEVVQEVVKPINEQIEEIKKASPGSTQGDDEITSDTDLETLSSEVAKRINEG